MKIKSNYVIAIKNAKMFTRQMKLSRNKYVVAIFVAKWCPFSKMMDRQFIKYSRRYKAIVFMSIDVDEVESVARSAKIPGLPAIIFYQRMNEIYRIIGAEPNIFELLLKNVSSSLTGNKQEDMSSASTSVVDHAKSKNKVHHVKQPVKPKKEKAMIVKKYYKTELPQMISDLCNFIPRNINGAINSIGINCKLDNESIGLLLKKSAATLCRIEPDFFAPVVDDQKQCLTYESPKKRNVSFASVETGSQTVSKKRKKKLGAKYVKGFSVYHQINPVKKC